VSAHHYPVLTQIRSIPEQHGARKAVRHNKCDELHYSLRCHAVFIYKYAGNTTPTAANLKIKRRCLGDQTGAQAQQPVAS